MTLRYGVLAYTYCTSTNQHVDEEEDEEEEHTFMSKHQTILKRDGLLLIWLIFPDLSVNSDRVGK